MVNVSSGDVDVCKRDFWRLLRQTSELLFLGYEAKWKGGKSEYLREYGGQSQAGKNTALGQCNQDRSKRLEGFKRLKGELDWERGLQIFRAREVEKTWRLPQTQWFR